MTDMNLPHASACEYSPVSVDQFRSGMRNLAGAVNIITVKNADQISGLTATAVMSITAEPPRVMVCINKNVHAHSLIAEGSLICVNALSADQLEDARIFAGMVKEIAAEDRFNHGEWLLRDDFAPELKNTLVSLQCKVVEVISASSHSMIMGEVIAVTASEAADKSALIYFDCGFSEVKKTPVK